MLELDLLGRCDHAAGDHVAAHDAAEDVDQHTLDRRVGEQDAECSGHPLLGGAAADVEEVGRLAAVVLDDVHGRHRKPGAVDHAADVAVELDVVEVELRGLDLEWLFLVDVAHLGDVLVAVERVVVEVHLGVESDHPAVGGRDQRVDLEQRGVGLAVGLGQSVHEFRARLESVAFESEPERELAAEVGVEPHIWVEVGLEDGVGVLGRDLFDLHAAELRRHHHRESLGAVEDHTQVELAIDRQSLFDEDGAHQLALGPGLLGDQGHAEDLAGELDRLVWVVGELDAAAFAASAGVDLRLDDDPAAELLGRRPRRFGLGNDNASRHRHPVLGQHLFALILVDLHMSSLGIRLHPGANGLGYCAPDFTSSQGLVSTEILDQMSNGLSREFGLRNEE